MERRRNTRPGLLHWTPAPLRYSPAAARTSEDSWEDEGEEVDHFVGQMDENGIIGLTEALEDLELGQPCGYSEPWTPEGAVSSGGVKDRTFQSSVEDHQYLAASCDMKGGFKAFTEDQTRSQRENDRGRPFIMTEEEDVDEDRKGSDRTRKRNELPHTSGELEALDELNFHYCMSDINPAENSGHDCLVSEPAASASVLPHLYHFTEEELAAAPGIEAETIPDMGFTETESYCSHASVKSSPRYPETKLGASPQPALAFSKQDVLENIPTKASEKQKTHSAEAVYTRTPSLDGAKKDPSKSKQSSKGHDKNPKTPGARNNPAGKDEFRRATLSHQTPDFSKVEPRVHFPKRGYKPPKSKKSLARNSLSPEPPMVFKSPADIIKEVLFNNTSSGSNTPTNVPNSIVPAEFRCPQQATTLVEQLQEDHRRLLTKLAEAENTIDRLRLEARVNLYSDPPKAAHSVHSGLNCNTSNFLKLDFSQAQRVEICSPGHSSPQEKSDPCPSASQLGQQFSNILFSQSDTFLQQLQTFQDLLKSDKLTSFEKLTGLSQLSESLDSLERGFLLARDEHKLLQQTGVQTCHFDPERELEGLVFQCGLQMDELKEQVGQIQQESFPPSPPRNTSSDPPEGGEITQTHQQSHSEPSQTDLGAAAEVEDRIISPETDSGFVGSDSSHLTPAVVPILLHQRSSESLSAPQDRNPMRPQSASLSLSHLDQEPTEGHTLDSNQRTRSRQRRRRFYSPQSCISQKNQARADDGSSDSWMMSDAPSASEEQRSDPFFESVDSPLSANSTSPPGARHCHGHPLRVANPSHGGNYKDAFMKLQAEVEKLKEKLDISLRNEKPLSAVTAAPSAQKICFHHTPSPSIRSREGDVSLGRRSAQAVDELEQESGLSETRRETSASAQKQQQQSHILRRSEIEQPQSQVSRCTQTSVAPHSISSVNARSRNTQTWMSSAPDAADEPDSIDQVPLCPQCSSILRGPAERPLGGSREPSDPCCRICGRLKLHECTDSDCHRHYSSMHLNHQPADSSDRARRYTAAAVSPSALQYMPWYPPHILLCSTPLYTSPDHIMDSRSGMRRSKEKRVQRGLSGSVDRHRSLDGSLDRAIRAAQHMKHTSRNMALSLASGLQYRKLLSQSCSY
ncbi:hypothetical protein CRENBAI_023783 [Crenichthys baileyi]|uniref:AKNA domain-containing protein n=1 Tax=Crenichthys baileyi TaxID=28760 RepID=A0AAV9QS13_9TELE